MVGSDGTIGMASALNGKIAMSRAIIQLGGDAMEGACVCYEMVKEQSDDPR